MFLNLFETVAHFVALESLHGLLLCGPPLLDHTSVALRFEKKVSTFESALFAVIVLISKKRSSPLEKRFLP